MEREKERAEVLQDMSKVFNPKYPLSGREYQGLCDLYDKGYRKIPDGAVVLTKEEAKGYEEYKAILAVAEIPRNAAYYWLGQKRHDEIAKETAREIYIDFVKDFFEWDEESFKSAFKEYIKEKYGLEVE